MRIEHTSGVYPGYIVAVVEDQWGLRVAGRAGY